MKTSTTTYTCDLCEKKSTVKGPKKPAGWLLQFRKEKDLCNTCISEVTQNLTLAEAKELVRLKTPTEPIVHEPNCYCQACRPD